MGLGFHLWHHMLNQTIFANYESAAQHAHIFAAHKFLHIPGAIAFGNLMIFVGEQG